MLERPLRALAVLASLLVVVGWGLFAVDEARSASAQTATEIEGRRAAPAADPSPEQERLRERTHSGAREYVDDANDLLLAPFASAAPAAGNRWVRRSVPAALALLFYGVGVGFLARFAAGH